MSRKSVRSEHTKVVNEIDVFVQENLKRASTTENSLSFTPRPAQIEVKNCTKINRDVQRNVISTITKHLLTYSQQILLPSGITMIFY